MLTTMRLFVGVTAIALLAGCQNSKVYGVSDVKPSKFILGLLNPEAETPPIKATASAVPAPVYAPAPAPIETVVFSPEYVASEPLPLAGNAIPVYLESSGVLATNVYADEQLAPTLSYQETSAVAYGDDAAAPTVAYVEEPAITYIDEPSLPVAEPVSVASFQTEPDFIAVEPVAEPGPDFIAPVGSIPLVEEPIATAALPVQPAFVEEPSSALAIEVAIPTDLDEIAPPPVIEASALPSLEIEEALLDAPVLPSTEILESELAPLATEAEAPPRPTFTPIPQPGLSNYGSAF